MNSSRRSVRIVLAFALVALAACSGDSFDGRPDDDDDQNRATTIALSTTTTEAPRLEQRAADVALPVSFTAGDVVFDVTKIEFSNATPGSYLDAEPDLIDDELLYVTFTAWVDPTRPADTPVRDWPVMSFKLVTSGGRVIAASGVDFMEFIEIGDDSPTTAAVVFPADDADLVGARLRLDDGVNPPAEVAFTAPVPATAPPESTTADAG